MRTADLRPSSITVSLSRMIANSLLGARRFTDRFARTLASSAENKQILEIGSGRPVNGGYPYSYKHYFSSTNTFIQSDVDAQYGHRIVDVTNMPYKEEFDIILCLNVLEHVFYINEAAYNLYRATKRQGTTAIIVPALYPLHDEPHDYWRMTEHSLSRLFSRFVSLDIKYSGLRRLPFMYSVVANK